MKSRLFPALAVAAVLALTACSGEPAATEAPRPEAAPVDTSVLPPQSGAPAPDDPTTPPAGAVTADNLPVAEDLQWNDTADWRTAETSVGGGTEQLSVCQQNSIESLGGNAVQVRTFTLSPAGGQADGEAVAVAMSFDSREFADQGYATAQEWLADCQRVLAAQERTDGRQVISPIEVSVPSGRAQVTEWSYQAPSTGADSGEFESQGLVQQGDRVALVVMRTPGQDNNWDVEPGGPVGELHPMIRTLPAVADRLTR
ncbi:hypothetical protein [Granulicoccus sp. GXG6511]|uniref:hypothetical protein n=1 Tax=Granulicoccus sp. GXG6511 TaxID=3381351 RepID=UPI003D7DCDE8